MQKTTFAGVISAFGAEARAKLDNPAISGAPEDQLRAPLEGLFHELAALGTLAPGGLSLVGETTLSHLQTRPDYAVSVNNALVGFIEVKAPGKGCDPRKFSDPHDKGQWGKLKSLPNLVYTDGNGFSLWRNGELAAKIVLLDGDIETSGAKLKAPETLRALVADFLNWAPQPPTSAKALAQTSARLCRLLREEVLEEMEGDVSAVRRAQGGDAVGSRGIGFHVAVRGLCAGAGQDDADRQCGRAARRARHALVAHRRTLRLAGGGEAGFVAGAAHRRRRTSARRGHDYISLFVDMARRKVVYVADGKDAATVKEFADFLEAHGGRREAVTDASIDMGAAFEAGIKENFPNAEITFDKFHVIKLANEAVDQVRREEARNNFQIKGRRYIFLKNVDRLTQEEKEALSRLEAQNLDTIQAMQIRMNLQQLFTMSVKSARRFLDRWNAWVQVCDLAPMKKLAKTITAKSEGILRSIATGLSNGVLEAINGNVQAAKRKAKGYRTKRNLKAIVYLIAGDVLANSPI